MTRENLEDCFQMALKWRKENECEDDDEKRGEMCVALNSLRLFEELHLTGGVLRIDGEVVAFTIGEPICEDTYVVHIEKAYADVQGAYTMINQQFVEHECMNYKYVNREDDTGAEGLRKAKLSYRPVYMVEKGDVTEKDCFFRHTYHTRHWKYNASVCWSVSLFSSCVFCGYIHLALVPL